MPFFQFEATDAQGRLRQGQIQGTTPDQVRKLLVGQGLANVQIRVAPTGSGGSGTRQASSQSQSQSQSVRAPAPARPADPVIQAPAVRSAPAIDTPVEMAPRKLSDKHRMFFFGQLGRFYQSGIAPNRGLETLSDRARNPGQREVFRELSDRVGSGESLGTAMKAFPRYFSPSDAATIAAGEASGEVASACDFIAHQADKSHRLKRQMFWFMIILCCLAGLFPILLGIVNGSLKSMKVQDEAGGSLPAGPTAMKYAGEGITTMLPWLLLGIAVFVGLRAFWLSDRFLMLRQRLVLMVPLVNGRATAESLMRFAWALQNLAKAGLSPKSSMEIAADSLVNRELARRAREAAAAMRENEPLSLALKRAELFNYDMNNVVETGEITGDVPRAMAQVAASSQGEFEARDSTLGPISRAFLIVPAGIMVLMMLVVLYYTLYNGIFRQLGTE
jgi:general secretion pathway protein F